MVVRTQLARGIRNNNPLNIEHNPTNKWLGLANPPSDGRFCRFVSADYGVRAAALLLMCYQDRYGINTVSDIVAKWAPATENNTSAYVAAVAKHSWFTTNGSLDLHDRETMRRIIAAMAKHETGTDLDDVVINRGLALAGFAAPTTTTSVLGTPTMFAASVAAAPAAAVAVGSIIDGITNNGQAIAGVVAAIGGPIAGSIALGVLSALGWGWGLYNRLQVRQESGV